MYTGIIYVGRSVSREEAMLVRRDSSNVACP